MNASRVLDELLQDPRVRCGAVIDEFGEVLARAGDFDGYPAPGLVSSILGPSGTPGATYAGLDGQSLPQIWAEGDYYAVIDRPARGIAFVLFVVPSKRALSFLRPRSGEYDSANFHDYSKRVSRRLREAFSREASGL